MRARLLSLGILFILLASFVSAAQEENYLIKKCESIIGNDFMNSLEVSDVEEKGTLNILVGTSYNGVLYNFVYDASTKCYNEWDAKSSVNTGGNIEEIVVRDADYDAKKEIIVNGAKTKGLSPKNPDDFVSVFTMNADSLVSKWSYDKGDSGCAMSNSVDTADLYGTGEEAILMGTESKKVCAFGDWSKNKRQILWVSPVLDNPVKYIEAGDFNNDGSAEIVVLTKLWSSASVYLLDHNGQILWKREITGGVRTDESKNIWVDDLDGDEKLEILVGTQDHGIDILDSSGSLKWNFKTASGSKTDIVSKVRTYKYFTSDEARKIVVAAKPYIYLLDNTGKLLWKAPVNTTVFDFDYGDVDNDGRNELVAGATSYIYVYSDDGRLEGSWSYASEIQGLTGVYKKRDMDTVKVAVNDFDSDGVFEIVAAFRWFDDQLAMNVPQGSIRVFELNPDYKPDVAQTTEPTTQVTEQTTRATTPTTRETTTTLKKTTTTLPKEEKRKICPCLPLLPAAIALAALLAFGIPLALYKK